MQQKIKVKSVGNLAVKSETDMKIVSEISQTDDEDAVGTKSQKQSVTSTGLDIHQGHRRAEGRNECTND